MSVNGLRRTFQPSVVMKRRVVTLPLELERNDVHNVHVKRDEQTRGALLPQRARCKAHRRADVHGVAEDVEREAFDAVVHEDAEVVAEEGARDPERVRRGHHERLPGGEERERGERGERRGEERVLGLVLEGALEAVGGVMVGGGEGVGGRTASRGACLRRRCRARGSSSPCVRSLRRYV